MSHALLSKRWGPNLTPSVDYTVWALGGLAVVFFVLRILARTRRQLRLWLDDYLLTFALLALLGNAASITAHLRTNFIPTFAMTDREYEILILTNSLVGTFNSFAQGLSKTSITSTYWRLVDRWWRVAMVGFLVVLNGMLVGQVFTYWMKDCRAPGEPYRIQAGGCMEIAPIKGFRIATQSMSLFVDLFLTLLPWKIVWHLNMKKFEKFGLAFAMSLGFMASVAGIVRLVLWIQLPMVEASKTPFYGADIIMWNYIEPALTCVAACIPVLRVLVMEHIPGTIRNRTRQSTIVSKGDQRGSYFKSHSRARSGQIAPGSLDLEAGNKANLHEWSVEARSFEPAGNGSGDEISLIDRNADVGGHQNQHIVVDRSVTVESTNEHMR